MHDIPAPPDNIHISSYADDITITSTHTNANTRSTQVQPYITQLEDWLAHNRLKLAPTKSTSTLLTSHTKEHQHRPTVTLNNNIIPHTHETKILVVTYNTSMSFGPHIQNIETKCRPRLNTLRALTGTFGPNKETLTLVNKQYIRSVLDYASTAWAPIISPTLHRHLQTIQNTALRIALGSTQTTPSSHVHAESKVLSLKEHLDTRGAQFLASALHNPLSPSHHFQYLPPTPRQIANTPYNYYLTIINSIPPPTDPANSNTYTHT